MQNKNILVVDDEKNIRLTMTHSLDSLGAKIDTAINGEEALKKLKNQSFDLVFLDLKMPGINGMEVLRQINENWQEIRVIIITAHGTIESAVEAMKLGAADFIQKPFSPDEIRNLAKKVFAREDIDEEDTNDYSSYIELAKRCISDRDFSKADKFVRKAIEANPDQPEPYNLLGALREISGNRMEAQKFYRASLDIDPTYKPAWTNLERATSWENHGEIELGTDDPEGK
ncbi:MAG: response regulator [Myxococcota bacterium]